MRASFAQGQETLGRLLLPQSDSLCVTPLQRPLSLFCADLNFVSDALVCKLGVHPFSHAAGTDNAGDNFLDCSERFELEVRLGEEICGMETAML